MASSSLPLTPVNDLSAYSVPFATDEYYSPFPQQQQPGAPPGGADNEDDEEEKLPDIRGIEALLRVLGRPDAIDFKNGGIVLWSRAAARRAKIPYVHRIDLVNEAVRVEEPVPHTCNVYCYVYMKPNNTQLTNILRLSKNFYYDRRKYLMIIRSCTLRHALAQAALLVLYISGKVSYYKTVNNGLLKTYFRKARTHAKTFHRMLMAHYRETFLYTSSSRENTRQHL